MLARRKQLPPSVTALLLQFAAFALAMLSVRTANLQASPLPFALLCGLLAATLSHFAGLARWWLVIQLLFIPALVLMLTFEIQPGFFLAAFIVMLAVYWSTFRTQVPLYLSSNKVWRALEDFLPEEKTDANFNPAVANSAPFDTPAMRATQDERPATTPFVLSALRSKVYRSMNGDTTDGFSFIDLGSGLGGVLTHLAAVRPDGHYSGVESAPLPLLWSWLRIKLGGWRNCEVHWGSLWNCDLAQYDVVFAYLSPVPMEQLWRKARAEMRPGTVFISSTFAVPEQAPHQTVQVDDLHRSALLVWRM